MGNALSGIDTTVGTVSSLVSSADSRATSAITSAFAAIGSMAASAGFVVPSVSFGAPSVHVSVPFISGVGPSHPSVGGIKSSVGSPPGIFTANVASRAMQDAPQENFSTPIISFPTAPLFEDLIKPSALSIALPDDIPDTPSVTLPIDLTVGDDTIPNIPTISLPEFGEIIPTLDISLPETVLAYVEPVYTSALKTAIETKLLDVVNNGGTGLGATVQTDIWNKDIERLNQQKDDDVDKTINLFAGRGFDMPTGMLAAEVQEILKNFANDRAQNSRTISIEEARIAKEMTQFFLSTGLSKEQIELNHANNVANRALEAEKSVVEFSIALFNSQVSKFNLELERYKSKQIEVEMKLKIQELVLSQYLAEIQGVEAGTKQDAVRISNYNAILASHDISIKLYEAEVGAVLAQLNIERAKSEIFKAEIDGYVAELQAQKNESDLYLAEIEGESAKIGIFRAEVDAYATRVTAVKSSNDVVIQQIQADISEEELNLKAHIANIDSFRAKADLGIAEMGVTSSLYRTDASVFEALIRNAQAGSELNVQTQLRAASLDQAASAISLQGSIASMNAAVDATKIRIMAATAMGQASAGMAGMAAGAVQSLVQLGGQGTSIDNTELTAAL